MPPEWGTEQSVKKSLGLLQRVANLLLARFQRRQRDCPAGVVLDHAHLHSVGEDGGDQRQVVFDGLGGQALHAVDELLELPGRDFVHIQMADTLINAWGHLSVIGLGLFTQGLFHVLREPLAGEGFKLDVSIGKGRATALLVKEDHLPGQFLLDLPLRQAGCGRPGFGLHYLFALWGVSARDTEPIRIAALCVGCHCENLLSDLTQRRKKGIISPHCAIVDCSGICASSPRQVFAAPGGVLFCF